MIKVLCITLMALFLTACSSGPVSYAWQGETKSYLLKYQEMMLKGDSFQAAFYLKDAIKEARHDVSLHTLAVVYLSECAMTKALGQKYKCSKYQSLEALVNDPKLQAYDKMLGSRSLTSSDDLGKYGALHEAMKKEQVSVSDIDGLDTIYAKAIAAMLVKEKKLLTQDIVDYMIDQGSRENMKALILVWLKIAKGRASGERLAYLEQKIALLQE